MPAPSRNTKIALIGWAPLAVPLLVLPWLGRLVAAYRDAPLSRDVGMFRLSGWCLERGLRLYSDVITPDGPLVHFVNAIVAALTDGSERSFRTVDLALHTMLGGAIGALIAPHAGRARCWRAVSWGLALATLSGCHVLGLEPHDGGQRELYYAGFGHLGMALLFAGSHAVWDRGRFVLMLGGSFVGMQLLGKPTGIVFVALGLLCVALAENTGAPKKARLIATSTGIAFGVLVLLAATAAFGSLSGFFTWYFEYPYFVYRFYAWHSLSEMLALAGWQNLTSALVCAAVGGSGVALGLLPRSALGFSLLPLAHLGAALAQRKGWPYHFVPIGFATDVVAVMVLAALWHAAVENAPPKLTSWLRRPRIMPVAWVGLVLLASRSLAFVALSPLREPREYAAENASRSAAFTLRATTRPDDQVFYVGEDSQILLFARRLPASPYLMSFFLDFSFATPSAGADVRRVEALQRRVQADACSRLAQWPRAIVIGPSFGWDARAALARVCPVETAEIPARYSLGDVAGGIQTYVRKP